MIKIIHKLILTFIMLAVLMFCGIKVSADGGYFPSEDFVIEGDQKAFIYYHNGIEDLVISTSYYGDASDFVWIVPTPNQPEIFESNSELFDNLKKITESTEYNNKRNTPMSFDAQMSLEEEVEVIEEKTIDIYNTAVIKASNEYALVDWLNENGYKFPKELSYQLSEYVDKGWYYAVVKIRPELNEVSQIEGDLYSGSVTPLRFSFQTDEIIYPMKLTKVALDYSNYMYSQQEIDNEEELYPSQYFQQGGIDVIIYVLSESKVKMSQLDLQWANWLKSDEINLLENSEQNWLKSDHKLFLTKFYNFVYTDKIDQDYVFNPDENSKFPVPVYQTGQFWVWLLIPMIILDLVILLSPVGLLFIIFLIIQHYTDKKSTAYLVSSIFQILISAFLLLTTVFYVLYQFITRHSFGNNQGYYWGLLISLVSMFVISLLIVIKKLKYRSKN